MQAGNPTDIEATKRQARFLVEGHDPQCSQAWIVETRFTVTPESPERKA